MEITIPQRAPQDIANMSEEDHACETIPLERSDRPDEEVEPEQSKPEVQLTETLRLGTQDLHSRAEIITAKVTFTNLAPRFRSVCIHSNCIIKKK